METSLLEKADYCCSEEKGRFGFYTHTFLMKAVLFFIEHFDIDYYIFNTTLKQKDMPTNVIVITPYYIFTTAKNLPETFQGSITLYKEEDADEPLMEVLLDSAHPRL